MKRLFLVYDEKDFAEWIEDELAEYGRFVRNLEGMDFFFPQWNAIGSADVIILPETVIKSQESFMKLYETVKTEAPETIFLLIYHRDKDPFIEEMLANGNVCVSYDELDAGLLEERLRNRNETTHSQTMHTVQGEALFNEADPAPAQKEQKDEQETSPVRERPEKSVDPKPVYPEQNERFIPKSEDRPERIESPTEAAQPAVREPAPAATKEQKPSTPTADLARQQVGTPHAAENVNDNPPPKKRRSPEEQKAKLQKIKERIVIEEKIVTVHVPVHFNSMLVSIVSLYPRAGATFVTANFARMLGENKVPVAVVEPVFADRGSTYYELMYGDKNAPKEWQSWAEELLKNGYISQKNNWTSGGVAWIPSNVDPTPAWKEEHTMQLLLAAKRFPVTLCDISSHYTDPQSKKILSMSDEIWIVTDGDPIQLGHHYKAIDTLKNEYTGKRIKVIGNKWHSFIKQSEWKEAVLLPVLTQIPDLGPSVLKHLWDGKMAWDDSKLKNILAAPFKPMARTVMAKEMYGLLKKQYGWGAKLSGLFRQIKSLDDEAKARKY